MTGAESKDPENFYRAKPASGSSTDALSLNPHWVFMPRRHPARNPRTDHRWHSLLCFYRLRAQRVISTACFGTSRSGKNVRRSGDSPDIASNNEQNNIGLGQVEALRFFPDRFLGQFKKHFLLFCYGFEMSHIKLGFNLGEGDDRFKVIYVESIEERDLVARDIAVSLSKCGQ